MVKVSFVPRALPIFDISLVAGKKTLSGTIVSINSDKAVVNQLNEEYDLTSEPQTLETLQNAFILIYRCEIYPYYAHIMHIFIYVKKQMLQRLLFLRDSIKRAI